jgi:F420-dependent oxidoreductase-like protein
MRYAVKTAPQMTTWGAMLEFWQAADEIDVFESAWNFDHFEPILGAPRDGPCLEAWTMLGAMAQATSRIRIGALVTGATYRHPSVLANMAATVDVISDGRLELGIGAGWNQDESDALGLSMPALKERFDRFDETCEILIGLLTEDRFSYDGEYHQLVDANREPKGVQRPHPPITIGGGGEKRLLRAVARYAQRWNTIFIPGGGLEAGGVEMLEHKLEVLRGHCQREGRDFEAIDITVQTNYSNPAAAAEAVEALEPAGCDLLIFKFEPEDHRADVLEPLARQLNSL